MESTKEIKLPEKSKVQPLDYSKVENWVINANADLNTDYDLIFFCGTSIVNATEENGVGRMTDAARAMGYNNYMAIGSQLSDNARVFCPLQRQQHLLRSRQHPVCPHGVAHLRSRRNDLPLLLHPLARDVKAR